EVSADEHALPPDEEEPPDRPRVDARTLIRERRAVMFVVAVQRLGVRAHACTSSLSAASRLGFMTACLAPGTPYPYGPPTTCGISSQLKIGGGRETRHPSVRACQGFASAIGPRAQLVTTL